MVSRRSKIPNDRGPGFSRGQECCHNGEVRPMQPGSTCGVDVPQENV